MAGGGFIFFLGLIAFAAHLTWQVLRLDIDDPAHCLMLFKSNATPADFCRRHAAGRGGLRRPRRDSAAFRGQFSIHT